MAVVMVVVAFEAVMVEAAGAGAVMVWGGGGRWWQPRRPCADAWPQLRVPPVRQARPLD